MAKSTYISARPLASTELRSEPFGFYHERYRGFAAGSHSHGEIQLLVPLGGRMRVVADGTEHVLAPEWAAAILEGTEHASTFLEGEVEFLSVYVPTDWFRQLAESLGTEIPTRGILIVRDARLWLAGQQLAAEVDSPLAGSDRVLLAGLDLLAIGLARSLSKKPAAPILQEPRIMRAVDRILRDYAEDLRVESLATEFAMSPRHFERCFNQTVGTSPRRFLIEVRIGAAKDLLAQGRLAITDIAFEVGFKNLSHFSETFQRVAGLSPSAYRQSTVG